MPATPIPDYDSDLWTGDMIDLRNPPSHCGTLMRVLPEPGGYRLDCHEDDCEIHVDADGVLTEPPYITE